MNKCENGEMKIRGVGGRVKEWDLKKETSCIMCMLQLPKMIKKACTTNVLINKN